jgi:hypothetical protein
MIVSFAVLLLGCASVRPVVLPDGRAGFHISCAGSLRYGSTCLEHADESCPKGYETVRHDTSEIQNYDMSRFGITYGVSMNSISIGDVGYRETMDIVCRVPKLKPVLPPGACTPAKTRCITQEGQPDYEQQPQTCTDEGIWYDSDVVCSPANGTRCSEGACVRSH